jgi:hypothetical protein
MPDVVQIGKLKAAKQYVQLSDVIVLEINHDRSTFCSDEGSTAKSREPIPGQNHNFGSTGGTWRDTSRQ